VPRRKVLLVSSNHAAIRPGGLESYTQGLYEALRSSEEFDPVYLARAGPPFTDLGCHHGWSPFAMVGDDPNQYLFYTDTFAEAEKFDRVFRRWAERQVLTRYYRDFLLAHKPDVVHFHHLNYLGWDILRVTRNTLPDAPILFTLHEYLSICHNDGQLVRTRSLEMCHEPSPRRCHECFPSVSAQTFAMRNRFIESHLAHVDCFIAPLEYVRDRHVEWGLPPEKFVVESQAMAPVRDRVPDEPEDRPRNRFAYFGQINRYKGADVLLDAVAMLGDDFEGHLWIFGANLEIQPKEVRKDLESRIEGRNVTFAGSYDYRRMGKLMAGIDWVVVPSIWWETGPMVVVEAFQYGRPVICGNMGGQGEKVKDGYNGLHFRRRDAADLADVMRRAAETPGLWDELRANIPSDPLRHMDDHLEVITALYKDLIASRQGAGSPGLAKEELASA
jgi:glycosyltransferase involved in cell wall biosynthesis